MLNSFFSKIYHAITGSKGNVNNLPGDLIGQEEEAMLMARINMEEFEVFLRIISSLFEESISEQDIRSAVDSIQGLNINEFTSRTFKLNYNCESVGITIDIVIEQSKIAAVYFLTDEKVAYLIQEVIAMFHLPFVRKAAITEPLSILNPS